MYTDLYTRQRKPLWMPIIGVFAVVAIVGAAFVYTTRYAGSTRASQGSTLENEVVNVTSKQVSIYWETEEQQQGWVLYGDTPEKLETVALDDRDKGENRGRYKLHLVTLKNLNPNKQYYYKIVTGNAIFTDADKPYTFKTPNSAPPLTNVKPVYGKVAYASGKPLEGGIVKLYFEEGIPLYTFTKSTGEWLVPLQSVYTKNLTTTLRITGDTVFTIDIVGEDLSKSRIQTVVQKSSPLPQTVVLGTDYDFNKAEENVLPAFTSQKTTSTQEIDIVFPRQGSVIPGFQPLIKGKAIPNTRIQLELNSKPSFRFSSLVNERGDWYVNVPKPLDPGTYSLTLFAKNSSNEDVVLIRSFTLAKSGEQVLAEATGPGTVTPSVEPTEEPIPTLEPTATTEPTPTDAISPTGELSPTVQATISATIAPTYIAVTPAPPVSGGNGILYTVISVGLLVVGGGVMLLL